MDEAPDLAQRGRAIFERLRGTSSTETEGAEDREASVAPAGAHDPADAVTEGAGSGDRPPLAGPAAVVEGEGEAAPGREDAAVPATVVEGEGEAAPAGEDAAVPATVVEERAEPVVRRPLPTDLPPPAPAATVDAGSATAVPDLGTAVPATGEAEPMVDDPPTADAAPDRFARPLPRVLAIANQKGGVGKTTTAVNLGAGLAELGYRVLVVDLDPQGNATTGLGINTHNLQTSIYDVVMHDAAIEDSIEPSSLKNLFVAPATIDLAGAEIELVPAFSRELKLKRAIEDVKDDFDFVLIDCPPSLGLLTVNGLAAADEVVVPIQCEYYALEGLGQLLRNVQLVTSNLNPTLDVSAIVLTMYDARTKLAEQVVREVRSHFGDKVCRTIVPRTVRLSEAPSFGQPVTVFDPSSRGAIAYRELAKEVSGGTPQRAR